MRAHTPILAADAADAIGTRRAGTGASVRGRRGRRAGAMTLATAAALTIGAAVVSTAATAAATPAAAPARAHAPWQGKLQPCTLPDVKGGAFCGSFEVYENRDAQAGRKIALRIAVLPALAARPEPDPVFIINGGPGEGAVDSAPDPARDPLRRRRDIVLVDTRGTGGSNPLTCKIWGDGTRLDHIFPLDAVETCRDQLRQHADLALYTTAAAMDDLEDVRRYLGYGQVNLIGTSYGTLASQVFIARHPESVRSVVLESVARYADPSPLYHARNAQQGLELLARDCAHDGACHAAFPHFADEAAQVLARLAQQPAHVTIAIPDRPKPVTVTLTRSAAADAMRFSLYSSEAAHLPLWVHRAAGGDLRHLALAAVEVRMALQQELALGLLFSVTCAEDLSRIDPATIPQLTAGTFYGDDRVREQLAVCAVWPHAPKPAGPATLPSSTVPALLIAGERDPVTPPTDAAAVAANFTRGQLVIIPSGAHASDSTCTQRLIADFIARGTAQGLNTACAQHPAPLHFDTR